MPSDQPPEVAGSARYHSVKGAPPREHQCCRRFVRICGSVCHFSINRTYCTAACLSSPFSQARANPGRGDRRKHDPRRRHSSTGASDSRSPFPKTVDTSALLAVLFGEKDAENYVRAISEAEVCRISAATFVEISVVVESQTGDAGSRQWDAFLRSAGICIEPVTEEQGYAARQAWSAFGTAAIQPG